MRSRRQREVKVQLKSEQLKSRLVTLLAWLETQEFLAWLAARDAEIESFNQQILFTAQSWDEIVRLRALRENTDAVKQSFEDARHLLEKAIDDAVEAETQMATTSRN